MKVLLDIVGLSVVCRKNCIFLKTFSAVFFAHPIWAGVPKPETQGLRVRIPTKA